MTLPAWMTKGGESGDLDLDLSDGSALTKGQEGSSEKYEDAPQVGCPFRMPCHGGVLWRTPHPYSVACRHEFMISRGHATNSDADSIS